MPILLEVIVTSVQEAIEAKLGGADRLELVNSLEHGGLTPTLELVEEVLSAVSTPVRVMLRENASMSVAARSIRHLQQCAAQLGRLAIDGLVTGFVKNGDADLAVTREILAAAPKTPVTFHRAFDHLKNQARFLQQLQEFPCIDRVLTSGGEDSWNERKKRVIKWQRLCPPHVKMIFATGKDTSHLAELNHHPEICEVHVGRAARIPRTTSGAVNRDQVAALKTTLNRGRAPHSP